MPFSKVRRQYLSSSDHEASVTGVWSWSEPRISRFFHDIQWRVLTEVTKKPNRPSSETWMARTGASDLRVLTGLASEALHSTSCEASGWFCDAASVWSWTERMRVPSSTNAADLRVMGEVGQASTTSPSWAMRVNFPCATPIRAASRVEAGSMVNGTWSFRLNLTWLTLPPGSR